MPSAESIQLGEEIGAIIKDAIDARMKGLGAPVVNVPPSEVVVNVPQGAPAVVHVTAAEQPAPIVNVATTPAIVNVQAPAPNISIENKPADLVIPPAQIAVNVDMAPVAMAIDAINAAAEERSAGIEGRMTALETVMAKILAALVAPRELVMEGGKPVGVRVKR